MISEGDRSTQALSRREWLRKTLDLTLIGVLSLVSGGCHKHSILVCSDPAGLSDSDNSLRESLHYTEASPRSDKVCGRCAFFQLSAANSCGTCKLLKGPVNPQGRCDSWSAASQ
jgi:hypothetical protein